MPAHMEPSPENKVTRYRQRINPVLRAVIETGFIVFLFYSNLLMGQFTVGAPGQTYGLLWSIRAIFTEENFIIAIVTGMIGYIVFEFLRRRV